MALIQSEDSRLSSEIENIAWLRRESVCLATFMPSFNRPPWYAMKKEGRFLQGRALKGEPPAIMLVQTAERLKRVLDDPPGEAEAICYDQRQILEVILGEAGITQAGLGERLDMNPMSVSRQIDRLAAKGLVVRHRDGRDGRVRHLYATDLARKRIPKLRAHEKEVADDVFRDLEDPKRFLCLLEAVQSSLEEFLRENRAERRED